MEAEDPRKFLPKARFEWSQIPTRVEVDGKVCAECLSKLTPRTLELSGDLLRSSGVSVAIHIHFGPISDEGNDDSDDNTAAPKTISNSGEAAMDNWNARQAARSVVTMVGVPSSCALSAAAQANVSNSTRFTTVMKAAGLSHRFETAQAEAFRQAVNVSPLLPSFLLALALYRLPSYLTYPNECNHCNLCLWACVRKIRTRWCASPPGVRDALRWAARRHHPADSRRAQGVVQLHPRGHEVSARAAGASC